MQRILVALDGSEHSDKALDRQATSQASTARRAGPVARDVGQAAHRLRTLFGGAEYVDDLLASLQAPVLDSGDSRQRAERVLRYYEVARRYRQAIGDRLMSRARDRARQKGVQTMQAVLEDGNPPTPFCVWPSAYRWT